MALRVAIADDSYLIREALREMLTATPELEVVAVCEDVRGLMGAIERKSPDVVMSDIRMPPFQEWDGIRVATELRRTRPKVGVVILSQYAEPALALQLFESGSEGRAYLLKERVGDRDQLVDAIQAVADGRSVVDPKIIDLLIAERTGSPKSPLDELTARERQVLAEVAAGRSNGAIAASLFLTKRAVEKHINAIFMKLGLREYEDEPTGDGCVDLSRRSRLPRVVDRLLSQLCCGRHASAAARIWRASQGPSASIDRASGSLEEVGGHGARVKVTS